MTFHGSHGILTVLGHGAVVTDRGWQCHHGKERMQQQLPSFLCV